MKRFNTVVGLTLGVGLLTAGSMSQTAFAHGDKGHHKSKQHKDQHVTVRVDGKGYHPATINVKAGQEVHLMFVSKGGGCANEVRIPALKKSIDLKPGQKKEVIFTPKKGQIIGFACSMKMYKGKVVAK